MGSSVNRVAAGDSGPARCTRASSRTAGCSGRATVAPSCSATMAIDSGIGAAPAPAGTRGRMVSRRAVTTASLGFKWTDPRRSSRSHLVEVPSADAMNKSSSKSATVAATAGPPPSRAHGRSLPRDRVRLRPAENFQPVGTGFPNGRRWDRPSPAMPHLDAPCLRRAGGSQAESAITRRVRHRPVCVGVPPPPSPRIRRGRGHRRSACRRS